MIYANEKDLHEIDHLLIFDHTTSIAVLKLSFKTKDCFDMEEWHSMASDCLKSWAIANNYEFENLNAKVIKVYHDVN